VTTEAVVDALENPYDRKILAMAQRQPIEATQVIDQTDTRKSTVYRRAQKPCDVGLLEVEAGGLRNGHAVDRYRATVSDARLVVREGRIQAEWDEREDVEPTSSVKPTPA